MTDHVLTSRQNGILQLRLSRPEKKNALNRAMYARLADELAGANDDAGVRVVLLTGQPGIFSSGNDIVDFAGFGDGTEDLNEVLRFLYALVDLDKPLIAAIDGLAVGIGTTVLFHCDLAYATPGSTFQTPFVDLGLVPEAGSSLLAPRCIGYNRAFSLLVLGERFNAQEAVSYGLVTKIASDAESVAMVPATTLAAKPSEALKASRRLLRGDVGALRQRIGEEAALFAERLASTEARMAIAGFLARRS